MRGSLLVLSFLLASGALALAPSPAAADDWYFTIYEQAGPGLGGAPSGPLGLDSRPNAGVGLGARLTHESGHGVELGVRWVLDLVNDQAAAFFNFQTDVAYAVRLHASGPDWVVIAAGPSIWNAEASYDSSCPTDCTPEEDAVGAAYDAHDSLVLGGMLAISFEHFFDSDDDAGLFLGVDVSGHLGHAVDDPVAPLRWTSGLMLRFGGHFEL